MEIQKKRRVTSRKVMAVAAGGLALGVGITATLAAWSDTEWVFGGNGLGGPGIGTSTFEVEQNTVAPFAAGTWTNEEENPGGEVVFGPGALDLAPGVSVYAPVALRAAPTSVGGDVELQSAVPAAGIVTDDADGLLFDAITVQVATSDVAFDCDADAFSGAPGAPEVIADGPLATTGGSAMQTLIEEAGSTQYYCFEITLPEDFEPVAGSETEDYMGRTIAPAWQFAAESN